MEADSNAMKPRLLFGNGNSRTQTVQQKVCSRLLQKTKLSLEDPTLLLEGFDAGRTYRKGSGTHTRMGGSLIIYSYGLTAERPRDE